METCHIWQNTAERVGDCVALGTLLSITATLKPA